MKYFRLILPLFISFTVCFAQIIEEIPSDSELILDNSDGSLEVVGGKQNDETNVEKLVQVPDGGKEKEFSTIEEKGNVTLTETNPHEPKHNIYRNCVSGKVYGAVEVVNATRLMELLIMEPVQSNLTEISKNSNEKSSQEGKTNSTTCVLVLFYARWCLFSSQAAPHFNALARYYPDIKIVAIDASKYQSFNTQFGIVGVPTIMFVYNGKPLFKFNDTSYSLEEFSKFVTEYTGLKPNGSIYVNSTDFAGPVPSVPSNDLDYCLLLSWFFIIACAIYFTLQSQWWRQFVELVQNTWRESNAQHEHTD